MATGKGGSITKYIYVVSTEILVAKVAVLAKVAVVAV